MKLYVLLVAGGTDPELYGPYKTRKIRDEKAKELRNKDEENGVFWLDHTTKGAKVGAYSNGFMEGQEGFTGS